jgi:hypothetical protein
MGLSDPVIVNGPSELVSKPFKPSIIKIMIARYKIKRKSGAFQFLSDESKRFFQTALHHITGDYSKGDSPVCPVLIDSFQVIQRRFPVVSIRDHGKTEMQRIAYSGCRLKLESVFDPEPVIDG